MSTRIGKDKILHPKGYRSIEDVCQSPEACAEEVRRRFRLFLDSYLKSEEIANELNSIQKETEKFYEETLLIISAMESEWSRKQDGYKITAQSLLITAVVVLFCLFSLLLSPLIAAATAAAAGAVGAGLVVFREIWVLLWNKDELKRQAINTEYKHCMSNVLQTVRGQFEATAGTVLGKLIDKVTENENSRYIEALEELTQELWYSCQRIEDKWIKLMHLESKIIEMEHYIFKFKNELKQYELQAEEYTSM